MSIAKSPSADSCHMVQSKCAHDFFGAVNSLVTFPPPQWNTDANEITELGLKTQVKGRIRRTQKHEVECRHASPGIYAHKRVVSH